MEVTVAMMDRVEAADCVARIKTSLEDAAYAIKDLHDREGWRALGYSSWKECCAKEFDYSRSHIYRLLNFAAKKISSTTPQLVSFRDTVSQNPNENGVFQNSETMPSDNDGVLPEQLKPVQDDPRDATGFKIPPPARAIWARRHEPKEFMSAISKVKCALERLGIDDPLYRRHYQHLIGDLEMVYSRLSDCQPYAVCTQCDGHPSRQPRGACESCRNSGMIGKVHWDQRTEVHAKREKIVRTYD